MKKKAAAKHTATAKTSKKSTRRRSLSSVATGLERAQRHLGAGHPEQALVEAEKLQVSISPHDSTAYLNLHRLMAFAAFHCGKSEAAIASAEVGMSVCVDGLDFYFVAAVAAARTGQYDRAAEFAETYLRLWNEKDAHIAARNPWDGTFDLRHQLLSAYGVALNEQGHHGQAEETFRQAIELEPTFDSSFINLAVLLKSLGRAEEALQVVGEGLKANPRSAELRRMVTRSGGKATISACMIVKNEEEFLPRCLESIRDVVDEIILVDTGSDDRTLEIAHQFGCKIHHYPWQGDFSSARNESMKYATKDWIFIIDADEELPAEAIPQLRMVTSQDELKLVSISVINKNLETGQVTSFLPSIRLLRRELNLHYFGIVHNRLHIPDGLKALRSKMQLYHYGYDISRDKLDKKLERSRQLLQRQLDEKPNDVYANFNMAQLLRGYSDATGDEKSRLILEHAGRVIDNPDSKLDMYFGHRMMALHQKAVALCVFNRFDEAKACCLEALEGKENYLDAILTLGDIHNFLRQFDEAAMYYHRYLDAQATYDSGQEMDNIILHNLEARHKAWFGLGLIAEQVNDPEAAIDAFSHVLEEKDPYLDAYSRLGKLYLDTKRPAEAAVMFEKEIGRDETSALAYFGLGMAQSRLENKTKALTLVETSLSLEPNNHERQLFFGELLRETGKTSEGLAHIRRAADLVPQHAGINFLAANLLFETGEMESAIEYYNKSLVAQPDNVEALNNLGNSFFKLGQYERACAFYEQILAIAPDYVLAYRNLGLACTRLNRREKALTALSRYAELVPADLTVYRVLGDLFGDIGMLSEAIGCYEKYLPSTPADHLCLLHLADAYLQLGHADSARAGYRQVLAIDPTCQSAHERLEALAETVGMR